jgi:DNA-binding NarL/FixJ family response regulator
MKASRSSVGTREVRQVFIVDDHPMTRRGLKELISHEVDLVVCGEADNAVHALEAIKSLKPHIALVDLTLPSRSGLMLIKDIRVWAPRVYVLALSMHDESLYAERVLRAGGHGYIMKVEGGEKLLQAIRQVLVGETYVSDCVARKIVDAFAGRHKESDGSPLGRLTDREFEIFQLLGQGLPSAEIGQQLHLSPKTVDSHRLHIKEKLHLQSLPALMRFAVRWSATEEML